MIDKTQLANLVAAVTAKVTTLGQLGSDWETMCAQMTDSLAHQEDKSKTLKRQLRSLRKEQTQSQTKIKTREQECQKTKLLFERSLSDIRNTYEKSQQLIKEDY